MKLKYLGTAAAEGIPAIFCECPVCQKARAQMGKDFRKRSGAVIDGTLLVDIPQDLNCSALLHNVYLPAIKSILVTHSHADHCDMNEMIYRDSRCFCKLQDNSGISLYGNEAVFEELKCSTDKTHLKDIPEIKNHLVQAFTPFETEGYKITPLPAFHKPDEMAYIYIIEKDGRCLLYGTDTGVFLPETKQYIEGNKKYFHAVSLDTTTGFEDTTYGHMSFNQITDTRAWLLSIGSADEKTIFVSTHYSHNGMIKDGIPAMHTDLEKILNPKGFIVAYDGMEIEI